MASLRDEAQAFQPKRTKNIAELQTVSVELETLRGSGTDKNGKPFEYSYVIVNGEEYRVPESVIAELKETLKVRPTLKTFKVSQSGSGMSTRYKVVALD